MELANLSRGTDEVTARELVWIPPGGYEERYLYWSVVSVVVFMCIHHIISPCIFNRYSMCYRLMNREKRMEWDSRFSSTIHAFVASVLSTFALIWDNRLWIEPVLTTSHSGNIALSISAGYMIMDSISMPFYWRGMSLVLFVLHHILVIMSCFAIVNHRLGAFFGIFRLMTELSTPVLNVRWFLRSSGFPRNSYPVIIATVIFTSLFFITRQAFMLPYWIVFVGNFNSPEHMYVRPFFPRLTAIGVGLGVALDILNLVWGHAVYSLAFKSLREAWKHGRQQQQACRDKDGLAAAIPNKKIVLTEMRALSTEMTTLLSEEVLPEDEKLKPKLTSNGVTMNGAHCRLSLNSATVVRPVVTLKVAV